MRRAALLDCFDAMTDACCNAWAQLATEIAVEVRPSRDRMCGGGRYQHARPSLEPEWVVRLLASNHSWSQYLYKHKTLCRGLVPLPTPDS